MHAIIEILFEIKAKRRKELEDERDGGAAEAPELQENITNKN